MSAWDNGGHIQYVCKDCTNPYCNICEGGLSLCTRCGSAEGASTSECPGVMMTSEQTEKVYAGELDFRGGQWVKECSPYSPAFYRQRQEANK